MNMYTIGIGLVVSAHTLRIQVLSPGIGTDAGIVIGASLVFSVYLFFHASIILICYLHLFVPFQGPSPGAQRATLLKNLSTVPLAEFLRLQVLSCDSRH